MAHNFIVQYFYNVMRYATRLKRRGFCTLVLHIKQVLSNKEFNMDSVKSRMYTMKNNIHVYTSDGAW